MKRPLNAKARPAAAAAGYSGTPLPKKLGIKEGTRVALLGAPPGFERTLGALPDGARLTRSPRAAADLSIWFVRSVAELERGIVKRAARCDTGGLWIAWPKQTSPLASDVRENAVRDAGLAHGIVDFKVCAVDANWSGLRFARRKTGRS